MHSITPKTLSVDAKVGFRLVPTVYWAPKSSLLAFLALFGTNECIADTVARATDSEALRARLAQHPAPNVREVVSYTAHSASVQALLINDEESSVRWQLARISTYPEILSALCLDSDPKVRTAAEKRLKPYQKDEVSPYF